tara:strand:- start:141 stop:833 length:693 start_codon:yes stop_codon:yes gene_type:complete
MASEVKWNGTIPEETFMYDIDFDDFGVGSSTIHRQWQWTGASDAESRIDALDTHPDFQWLKKSSARVSREEAFFTKAQITYQGIPPNTDRKSYSLKASLGSAPIETHPKFQKLIEDGFLSFDPEDGAIIWNNTAEGEENTLFGTESWLQPSSVYEEVWVRGSSGGARDFKKLGLVETPPKSDARPLTPEGTNFLFMGGSIDLIGDGSKMTRTWKLSAGGLPWHPKLYTKR